MIENGTRVDTPLGQGEVVNKEEFKDWNLLRYIVKLDSPTNWACWKDGKHPAFFERELKIIEDNLCSNSD